MGRMKLQKCDVSAPTPALWWRWAALVEEVEPRSSTSSFLDERHPGTVVPLLFQLCVSSGGNQEFSIPNPRE